MNIYTLYDETGEITGTVICSEAVAENLPEGTYIPGDYDAELYVISNGIAVLKTQ